MRKTFVVTILILIFRSSFAQQFTNLYGNNLGQTKHPGIEINRLSEHILQLKVRAPGFFSTNIVIVATQKGLVVIDTWHGPFIFEEISEIVRQQFGRTDFTYLINSHEDVDHASGDGFFKDIVLVGSNNLFKALQGTHDWRVQWESNYRGRIQGYIKGEEEKLSRLEPGSREAGELMPGLENLRKLDKDFENGFPILPDNPRAVISFNDSLKIELGNITIECYACKDGHTPSDILIYIPQEGFLFTGDAAQPTVKKNVNMEHWLRQLTHFSSPGVDVKMILSGHDVHTSTKQDLERLRDYLAIIWEFVRKAHRQGLTLDQIETRYSLDNEMFQFRSLVIGPYNTLEKFREGHRNNIKTIVDLDK